MERPLRELCRPAPDRRLSTHLGPDNVRRADDLSSCTAEAWTSGLNSVSKASRRCLRRWRCACGQARGALTIRREGPCPRLEGKLHDETSWQAQVYAALKRARITVLG